MGQTDGRVEHVVPFVHVADLARSTAFYELFGFEVCNTYEDEGERVWCWLERGQARESGAPGPDRQFRVDDPDDYCLMVTDAAAVVPPTPA